MRILKSKNWCFAMGVACLTMLPTTLSAAQGTVQVKGNAITLKSAFKQIESGSEYSLFYKAGDVDAVAKRNYDSSGTVEEVLNELLSGTNLSYVIKGKDIILTAKSAEGVQQAKQRVITGMVVEADTKEPIIGANVMLKNSTIGTITDIDGKFAITVNTKNPILEFSYLGMKTKEVKLTAENVVNVALETDSETLDEVVIVGAGTQKKVSVTGAITSVKGSSLKVPATGLSNAFAGRIAGVVASQTSGEPGSGSEFYIRGIGTFGGKATPLILLDDVEISSTDLNYVPAENIESFSILKDASATAIYGARGANGVMIVTTKGGDYNSKTSVNVTAENSFNFIDKFPEFVRGAEFMSLYNEAALARGKQTRYSDETIQRTAQGYNKYMYPDVDWKDVMFKDMSMRQKANINVSGGGAKVKYFMSLEVNHDSGILNTNKAYSWNNNINIMNYTFQNNIAYKLTPTTTIKMNMNAQIRQDKGPNRASQDFFYWVMTSNPVQFPVTYPSREGYDHILYGNDIVSGTTLYNNPYATMMTTFKETNQNTLNTVIKIDQDFDFITKGLKFNAWVNFKNWSSSSYNRSIAPYYYRIQTGSFDPNDPNSAYDMELLNTNGSNYISESDIAKASDQTFELQANLSYNTQIADVHNISAMALYKQREYRYGVLPNRNQGISGRLTYDYDMKYLFEFNFGYNGTERLAKKDRFGFFPAVSLGWVVSSEKWFEPLTKYIEHFKLRGSYGLVGSDELATPGGSYYLYIDKITGNNLNQIQWTSGQDLNYTLGGPELAYYAMSGLGWEKVKKLDLGFDLTFNNGFSVVFDYFLDKRYDIFMNREAWPQSLGYDIAKPWSNIGKMDNEGVEVSLNYQKNINKDLAVSFQGSFTYNHNKVVYQDEPVYPTVWQTAQGKPYGYTMGYTAEGLFKTQEEIDNSADQSGFGSVVRVGDIKYRDINGDGKIDTNDKSMISKYGSTPRIQYGFGGTVNYKNFDFGIFFQGSGMRTIMANGMDPFQEGNSAMPRNVAKFIANNHFDEAKGNFDAKYPRLGLVSTDISNNTQASTYWMRNGSFLRLKNVEIGYKIPYGRIYVSGANLLTFSPFDLYDPELSNWYKYPLQRTVNVGFQLNL